MYVFDGRGDATRLVGGTLVLAGIGLSFINRWFLLLSAWPGAMLIVSSATGFCPAEKILKQFGMQDRAVVPSSS